MKSIFLLAFSCLGIAAADVIPEWVTATGKTYHQVEVVSIKPDSISIRHEDGAARIPFDELTADQRTTYQLTREGRDAYLQHQQEDQRLALQAREQKRLEDLSLDPAAPKVITPAPQYVTTDEIKAKWLRAARIPSPLERRYKELLAQYQSYVQGLQSGVRDLDLEKAAAQLNLEIARKAGDTARAD